MDSSETAELIRELFQRRGSSLYGGEAVTQMEHALQAATLAEADAADPALIIAALLHDIGHLLHELPDEAPDRGVDDMHEQLAFEWLTAFFGPDVTEPVKLHVQAKRYLCATDSTYEASLSPTSRQSMLLQGGRFHEAEARAFERHPYFADGIRLRRWDDLAKISNFKTPPLEHFLDYVEQVQLTVAPVEAAR